MNQTQNMLQDFNTIENLHFQNIKSFYDSIINIKFQKNQQNLKQLDKLVKKLNSSMASIISPLSKIEENNDVVDKNDQNSEIIKFDELKIGQITLSIKLNFQQETFINDHLKQISKYMKFNQNLVSIHIYFYDIRGIFFQKYFIDFFQRQSHFDQLRHIKFEMRSVSFQSDNIKQLIHLICNISTLLSFYLYLNFLFFSDEDLKFIYSNLMKLKQLNTLYLISEGHFSNPLPKYEQIRNYHKKLLRVVTKNINFYDSKNVRNEYDAYSGDEN